MKASKLTDTQQALPSSRTFVSVYFELQQELQCLACQSFASRFSGPIAFQLYQQVAGVKSADTSCESQHPTS